MEAEPARSIGFVVLAAGASRRMGRPKQLIELDGIPLVLRAIDAGLACSEIWPTVVVLGAHAEQLRPVIASRPVLMAENPAWTEGIASSLRAGLALLRQFSPYLEGAIFTLCDQPALSARVIRQLLARRAATGARVVAAAYGGHAGAPAFIAREYFPALSGLTGDTGASRLIAALPPETVVTVDLPELAVDIDTPEDLERLRPPG